MELQPGWKKLAGDVTDKEYRKIVAFDNCTSYSQLLDLHRCPRLFQQEKASAKQPASTDYIAQPNLDFAFGHSVGAGISTLLATGSITAGLFASFVSWKADYFGDNGKGKSLAHAQIAIEQFHHQGLLQEYDVYRLPSGEPAVEIAFMVDAENGYQHYGHIDLILQHRGTKKLAVLECKTTGYSSVDEALYYNSSQALSYSVVLDSISPGNTDYEVIYIVYSSTSREWQILPFLKSFTEKSGWLQDLLLDHASIRQYRQLNFFPKRGESCANQFGRRCKYFGICDLTTHASSYEDIPAERTAENVNFAFKLSDLVAQQRAAL
jgi:hypothetical protein